METETALKHMFPVKEKWLHMIFQWKPFHVRDDDGGLLQSLVIQRYFDNYIKRDTNLFGKDSSSVIDIPIHTDLIPSD